ncbi:hypothetical protein, partial [Nodularia chucula]|uniref:hypothetical protein n=1 Tax=Nodularia chucula TaxID=3093667 RepID=UPI0039C6FAA1
AQIKQDLQEILKQLQQTDHKSEWLTETSPAMQYLWGKPQSPRHQQGVGGRVSGVGKEEDGDCNANMTLNSKLADSQTKSFSSTPYTPYPTPRAPIPPPPDTEDGKEWARPDEVMFWGAFPDHAPDEYQAAVLKHTQE